MAGVHNEQAVSVIVGTLLLILITVIAAAGLALMVSQMQKDEMNRQSHLAAVKSEKIEITGVTLESRPSEWDGFFPPTNTTSNQSYSSVTFSLTNLNTDEARVIGIAINDVYPHNFTAITDSSTPQYTPYNFSSHEPSSYVVIPASGRKKIRINLTNDFFSLPQHIQQNDQITIRVMTSMFNTFEKNIRPPNPVFDTHIETEDLGVAQRDVIVLDGSRSTTDNTIVRWDWMMLDRGNATIVNGDYWNDVANITPASGKLVRLNPMTIGPFSVKLKVADDTGMTRTSDAAEIPLNSRFIPPSSINFDWTPNPINNLTITVYDMRKKGVADQSVYLTVDKQLDAFPFTQTLISSNSLSQTDIYGNVTYVICGNGTATIGSGKLATKSITFSNNSCP